jgi:hypothetical protein
MVRLRLVGLLTGVIALVGVITPGAAFGAQPTIERFDFDDTFADELLTEECGVPVTTNAQGFVIVRTFPGEGTGVAEVFTIKVALTATAGDNTFRFIDVGADVIRIEPDGTAILSISGQVPFEFAGVLKIDLETGEAILEPNDRGEQQLEAACAALTG